MIDPFIKKMRLRKRSRDTHAMLHIVFFSLLTPAMYASGASYELIKRPMKMLVYCTPEQLSKAVAEAVKVHNATPREALKNVSPNDVNAGRMEEILKRRAEVKRLALQKRKEYNRAKRLESQRSNGGKVSHNG